MDGLDGISADVRGHVQSAPRFRTTPTGVGVWEFGVRLAGWSAVSNEVVLVRVPDEHFATLQRWTVPGKHLMARGTLRLLRWTGKDFKDRAQMVLEPTREVMPLDERIEGSAPAALDYVDPKKMTQQMAMGPPPAAPTEPDKRKRAAKARALLEDEPAPVKQTTEKQKRNARRYDEIFKDDG